MDHHQAFTFALPLLAFSLLSSACPAGDYPVVDTGQTRCFDNHREIPSPHSGQPFFGQDAQYESNQPAYRDNGDGTVSDLVTSLMWQQDPGSKKTFEEAVAGAATCRIGGYDDWRLPSIKELYSLILFSGEDADPRSRNTANLKPFINTNYFHFQYGDPMKGERVIDSQMATSTKYVSTTMGGAATMFGVNFADGRIKGYPISVPRRPGGDAKTFYVFYVRGNPGYGKNDFHDNGDGTVTDRATGLMWLKRDSGHLFMSALKRLPTDQREAAESRASVGRPRSSATQAPIEAGTRQDGAMNWKQALRWCEDLDYAGHSDWRLPNIKELQSIVDYTRSPDASDSAAINPIFEATSVRDALGRADFGFYWSSTTHKRPRRGDSAAYIAFGRSLGWMPGFHGQLHLLDVHGAGSQRSDPKAGDPAWFPRGRGPQGDVISIYNLVRPVRDAK